MTLIYLTAEHLSTIAEAAIEGRVLLRDPGLLASAAERPRTVLFGEEQYPNLLEKAAALMHSIARFHPLVDGNKRLAWLATYTFLELNGVRVTATNDEAYDLTIAVASGELREVGDIAAALAGLVEV
ncbi:type II toxin-antitoxin system death-on-curing family toxin [Phytomonospora endophytica]|uniref:Death-on-curing protein n=1 Tax=Phytomonospora endophytica TaxID=714109 RepID=A0A841FY80_9ACTN|nr:type II toxin-antitoxin system death-on-curing family toxin [Phytomonospora endophytica]MBB6037409.1 death-on-curing protein [Phytomonospora endophytica]GIG69848.1 toxin Doc [Phytomonospora endophytica]